MNCTNCGAELRKDDVACAACGTPVKAARTCPECHFPAPEGARFCMKCGASVEPSPIARTDASAARTRKSDPAAPRTPAATAPAVARPSDARQMHWIWPALLLVLALALGYWIYTNEMSGRSGDAREAAAPSAPAPEKTALPRPKTPAGRAFSAHQALQALYGNYDPNLDGAFWTVSGAPKAYAQWNGRSVFLRPLISRTFEQRGTTRHILVTNSLDVKDGIVVKQGAGCRTCPALIGASVFEKGANGWTLISRHDFLTVDGAWGAPPKVSLQFADTGAIELHFDRPSVDARSQDRQYSIVLKERPGGSARAERTP